MVEVCSFWKKDLSILVIHSPHQIHLYWGRIRSAWVEYWNLQGVSLWWHAEHHDCTTLCLQDVLRLDNRQSLAWCSQQEPKFPLRCDSFVLYSQSFTNPKQFPLKNLRAEVLLNHQRRKQSSCLPSYSAYLLVLSEMIDKLKSSHSLY